MFNPSKDNYALCLGINYFCGLKGRITVKDSLLSP